MRKLTPEERAAKKAGNVHVHDENCGHVAVDAPVAEEASAEDKPKKKKKSEEATVAEEA